MRLQSRALSAPSQMMIRRPTRPPKAMGLDRSGAEHRTDRSFWAATGQTAARRMPLASEGRLGGRIPVAAKVGSYTMLAGERRACCTARHLGPRGNPPTPGLDPRLVHPAGRASRADPVGWAAPHTTGSGRVLAVQGPLPASRGRGDADERAREIACDS